MNAVERIKAEVEADMCVERFEDAALKCRTTIELQDAFAEHCGHLTGLSHDQAVDVYLKNLRRLGVAWGGE